MTDMIPGYTYGTDRVPRSPLTLDELDLLKATLLFGEEDITALRTSRDILAGHVEEILDIWYGFVGDNPHLLAAFSDPDSGEPDADYLAKVRARFGRWIIDTAEADYDQAWLDYAHEIGLRHTRAKKNVTDGANAADHIPLRYVLALTYPITFTLRPFLARGGHDEETVDRMYQAWIKAVLLQVILWGQPYVPQADF